MKASAGRAASPDLFAAEARARVEQRLEGILAARGEAPARLMEALRYAVLGGGKRLRPLLLLASGEATGPARPAMSVPGRLLDAACAVEMIHTFSLVHDDLPALDNDDLRRGRPSLHMKFGEAMAILAGDALLNLAYEIVSSLDAPPSLRSGAVATLSRAVGIEGMIAGQVIDLAAEGNQLDGIGLHQLHALKTGALFTASCVLGGLLAGAPRARLAMLSRYGESFGLAFQIIDDILDVEGTSGEMGKSPGKDARAGKATFPALWGVEESRRKAVQLVDEACTAIEPLAARSERLAGLARGMLGRRG